MAGIKECERTLNLSDRILYTQLNGAIRVIEARRQALFDMMVLQASEKRLGRYLDSVNLTIETRKLPQNILGIQLEQLLYGAKYLCSAIYESVQTKQGGVFCVNGTMGAGKTTLLFETARALHTLGLKVTFITQSNELYRYEPYDKLSSGLGVDVPYSSYITVCDDGFEMRQISHSLKRGDVIIFIETLFSKDAEDLEILMVKARDVGAVVIFDNLLRFANATIPQSVLVTSKYADLILCIFGLDAFNPTCFGAHHSFISTKWEIEESVLRITGMPDPTEVIKGIFKSAVFNECKEEGEYLLWTTTLEVIQMLALHFDINLSQFFQNLNQSDHFYAKLLKEGRLVAPISRILCSSDVLGADYFRIVATADTAYELR